jgi:hypothetical protein
MVVHCTRSDPGKDAESRNRVLEVGAAITCMSLTKNLSVWFRNSHCIRHRRAAEETANVYIRRDSGAVAHFEEDLGKDSHRSLET